MKCNPWRWLWGLIPVIALGWVGVHLEHAKIERDLEARTKQAFASVGLGWADVSFSGRDGLLTGKAVEEGEAAKAIDAALATHGVRVVSDNSGLIDKVDRYEWTAMRRDNRIRINGLVPNEATRRDVMGIAKASFPTLDVEDRMRLARGAPTTDTWLGGVGFGIKQLAQLRNGQVDLDVTAMTVTGEAMDVQSYAAVKSALAGRLPPGVSLKADRVTPPVVKPHVWSAARASDGVKLAGYVPSEAAREEVLAAARASAGALRVVDDMRYGNGVPEGWSAVAVVAINALARAEEGKAEIRDGTLTLSMLADSAEAAVSVRNELQRAVPAAFRVAETIRVKPPPMPTISPYRTAANLGEGGLVLSGHVPGEDARKGIIGFARQQLGATAQIADELQPGLGQPQGWQKCVETGLATLARLGSGTAELVDKQLQIIGRSEVADLVRALPHRVQTAVGGNCSAEVRVTLAMAPEPDVTWSATLLDGGELVLGGLVAGREAHDQLLRRAAELFPRVRVTDRMGVTDASSANWTKTAMQGLTFLTKVRSGEVLLSNKQLTVSGEASDASIRQLIRSALASELPVGYRGEENIALRQEASAAEKTQEPTSAILPKRTPEEETKRKAEADACQSGLQSVMRRGTIRFERSSAQLDRASYPTLQRLAAVAARCANVRIEIAGHTDNDGGLERNQELSEQRAQSVADFLARAGVAQQHMHTIGYGETHPMVPNTSARNKARNRRIEFNVKLD